MESMQLTLNSMLTILSAKTTITALENTSGHLIKSTDTKKHISFHSEIHSYAITATGMRRLTFCVLQHYESHSVLQTPIPDVLVTSNDD